ncbi:MAG TPA: ABC transporter ATP-binding protein, partial [Candidatus Polarisedimenticolia bacterium]|nr:ABC transporter ATP-binding protein [Candidatus Polarisedimenticolia bacterium]
MSPPPAVEARGVSFTYRGGARPALSRVDLDLADGQWGLLVGPGGAGKTTLVRCLHRSIPQFHAGDLTGSIRVSGRQIEGQRVAQMASQVGVVFQDFESQIFSTTCLLEVAFAMENRGLPPGSIPGRAEALLESVGLAGFADRDPVTLSGGEKQRLVIAAVLALDPSVLLLDEPASDLDSGGRSDVYAVLGRQKDSGQRPAVLLVEHDLEGLPPTDGGALLVDGCVTSSWGGARGDGVAA